jgi:hypothetical protein
VFYFQPSVEHLVFEPANGWRAAGGITLINSFFPVCIDRSSNNPSLEILFDSLLKHKFPSSLPADRRAWVGSGSHKIATVQVAFFSFQTFTAIPGG